MPSLSAVGISGLQAGEDVNSQKSWYEPIRLGTYTDGRPASFTVTKLPNFHVGVVGATGSGKTYVLTRLVPEFYWRGATVVILDTQGDYEEIPGIDSDEIATKVFAYVGGTASINPFHVHAHPDGGGVFMAIRNAEAVLRMFHRGIGDVQLEVFRAVLSDTYSQLGFVRDNPASWGRPSPTIGDVLDVIAEKIIELEEGRQAAANNGDQFQASEIGQALKRHKRLQGVLSSMQETNLLSGDSFSGLPKGRIHRFLMRGVADKDRAILFHLIIDRLFAGLMRGDVPLNAQVPTLYLFLDEGKLASAAARSEISPLNRAASEGRKLGLGLVFGFQSPDQMTADVRGAMALKLVLAVDHGGQSKVQSQFRIRHESMSAVVPRQTGMLSVGTAQTFLPIRVMDHVQG